MVECSASSNNEDTTNNNTASTSNNSNNNNNNVNNSSNGNTNTNQQQQQQSPPPLTPQQQQANQLTEELFSAKGWGDTPIRQDTPWDLPPSPSSMPKPMLNTAPSGSSAINDAPQPQASAAPSAFAISRQPPGGVGDFTRAPGPTTSSMLDNNKNKPFAAAIPNRSASSSTWSAFGTPAYSDSEYEWPKSSGISAAGSSGQTSTTFDLAPDFGDSAKAWPGSMLMKSLEEDTGLNSNSAAAIGSFPNSYAASPKSPTEGQNDSSGIGTWSPVVKTGRPGSKWDGDGSENGRGDSGLFDDGTSIWGSPFPIKVAGTEWGDKSSDANGNDEKPRNIAGNNQAYRSPQSSSSSGMIMSSNFSPPTQHNRNPQTMKQPSQSQNFEQSNALSSQVNQPNRGLGFSPINVPSTQQLKQMVQQIQLAVQAGHLNPQILNQPLAPVTLQLLCQLLQQIKTLHQFQTQATKQQFFKSGNHPAVVNVQITKTKQNIINLQNQIAAQQANFLKTQAHNISSRQPAMPGLTTGPVGGPVLPPGISQSGDNNFRTGNDFHSQSMINNYNVDNMAQNGLTNSFGQMNLSGGATGILHQQSSRLDQSWRAPMAKQHQPSMASTSPFANPNLMNHSPSSMPKSMLNCGPGGGSGNGGGLQSSYGIGGMQACANAGDFARAPGPTSSMMDNKNKPFGVANRSSTWSAFGSAPSEQDSEWPKSRGISAGSSGQHNAVDMVPEFEPGKPWRGSMLMRSVEDDPTMTPASLARSLAPQRKTIWSDEIL